MSTILIVDDDAVCREPLAAAFRQRGFQTLEAADGNEALTMLREQHPDLMVLDLNIPPPDGLDVLRAVRRNPSLREMPVILLTQMSDREYVLTAAERGIQGYILKSQFSLEGLFCRVDDCLAARIPAGAVEGVAVHGTGRADHASRSEERGNAAGPPRPRQSAPTSGPGRSIADLSPSRVAALDELKPVVTRDDLIELVNEGLELRPLGPIVGQVAAVTGNAQCSSEDVAKVIMQDQALSIRLLRLANSSAYSRGHTVSSVKEAVQRIGTKEIRSLVMALGVIDQYSTMTARHIDPRLFWEHSIATGLIATAVAEGRSSSNADDYFLRGVLHDVGRVILLDRVPDAYRIVLEAGESLDLPLELIEPRVVLLDHCNILERAMEFWQFPRHYVVPVVNHHQSATQIKRLGPEFEHATMTVALADRLAHALLLGGSGNDVVYPISEYVEALQLDETQIRNIEASVLDEARNLKLVMLSRSNDEQWPDAKATAIKRLTHRPVPVFASANPALDAYRIFLDQISARKDPCKANLGVLHLDRANQLPLVIDRYRKQEADAGCGELPLLIIAGKGGIDESDPFIASRLRAVLPSPVRVDRLLTTINDLLSHE